MNKYSWIVHNNTKQNLTLTLHLQHKYQSYQGKRDEYLQMNGPQILLYIDLFIIISILPSRMKWNYILYRIIRKCILVRNKDGAKLWVEILDYFLQTNQQILFKEILMLKLELTNKNQQTVLKTRTTVVHKNLSQDCHKFR